LKRDAIELGKLVHQLHLQTKESGKIDKGKWD